MRTSTNRSCSASLIRRERHLDEIMMRGMVVMAVRRGLLGQAAADRVDVRPAPIGDMGMRSRIARGSDLRAIFNSRQGCDVCLSQQRAVTDRDVHALMDREGRTVSMIARSVEISPKCGKCMRFVRQLPCQAVEEGHGGSEPIIGTALLGHAHSKVTFGRSRGPLARRCDPFYTV